MRPPTRWSSPDPGGGWHAPRGSRSALTRGNFERVYHRTIARLSDPAAAPLRPTAARLAKTLRNAGPETLAELTARLAANGRAVTSTSVRTGLGELAAAGLAAADRDPDDPMARWSATTPERNPMLAELDLHGPHDFRHTFATWLRTPVSPARVLDEVMGHAGGHRASVRGGPDGSDRGSRIGVRYRDTTQDMLARVVAAIEERLATVLEVAEREIDNCHSPDQGVGTAPVGRYSPPAEAGPARRAATLLALVSRGRG